MIKLRRADLDDVPAIVALLANDKLGSLREDFRDPLPEVYYKAFSRINDDSNQELLVVEQNSEIIGTMQLSFLQYLTYKGGLRVQIEAVRVKSSHRSQGMGEIMIKRAIEIAKEKKAHVIQLTTDKQRPKAVRFYEKLGFIPSHEGMKLHL